MRPTPRGEFVQAVLWLLAAMTFTYLAVVLLSWLLAVGHIPSG